MARKGHPSGGHYEGNNSFQNPKRHRPQNETDKAAAKQYARSFKRSSDWGKISLDEILGTRAPTAADVRGATKRARQAANPNSWRVRQLTDAQTEEAIELSREGNDTVLLPYQPTSTIDPDRPRTHAAGYDAKTKTLRVKFRDGTPWEYYNVPPQTWKNFQRVKSPGRFINTYFPKDRSPYARGDF